MPVIAFATKIDGDPNNITVDWSLYNQVIPLLDIQKASIVFLLKALQSTHFLLLDIKDIEKYERYMNSNLLNRPIKNLFYVFGFGWCGDSPESVYVVPARELYDYDKDTCRITFPIKETEKE